MLVTNFNFKYALYKMILPFFQLFDTGRMHPVRERSIRALNKSIDYIDLHMPKAIGFETQKEIITYALSQAVVSGYYLEFGVFTGGTLRYMAKKNQPQCFMDLIVSRGCQVIGLGCPL